MWKISPSEVTLYRVVSDTQEEVIPIKGNPDMKKFMCISSEEFDGFIKEIAR